MKFFNNLKTGVKLLGSFMIVALLLLIVAVIGYVDIKTADKNLDTLYQDQVLGIQSLSVMESAINKIRGDLYMMIIKPSEFPRMESQIQENTIRINESVSRFRKLELNEAEKKELSQFEIVWTVYQLHMQKIIGEIKDGKTSAAISGVVGDSEIAANREGLLTSIANLVAKKEASAKNLAQQSEAASRAAGNFLLVFSILGFLLSIGLAVLITYSINTPVGLMAQAAARLATGELNRDISQKAKTAFLSRRDEIGILGQGVVGTEMYLVEMAGIAGRIASGDLTVKVQPRSDKDELGHAFADMVSSLRMIIAQVAENASSLAVASDQLSASSGQADHATRQIAATVQQVARGTSQQSESVNRTAAITEQMSRSIDGVARGAQEQAQSVARTSNLTAEISTAIQEIAKNAQAAALGATETAANARQGTQSVEQTVRGMETIRERVGVSSEKVKEMGSRSSEIGAIVETIQDIASQTNLLALNAAIEAARAGEHGKGFAVVADEVRKLAEKSASATKEISALVKTIQSTVAEAVAAMGAGAAEVENGVARANQSGSALKSILSAAESANRQVEEIANAAGQVSWSANELVSAMDSVSAVVEENTAATEEMSAGASEVTQSIENIASVSQESGAAVQEVSAAAEQMAAQVEEVSESARSLAGMAQTLQAVVARFRLGEGGADEQPVVEEEAPLPDQVEEPVDATGSDQTDPILITV